MTIKKEISLRDFEFWGGAKEWAKLLTPAELDTIEELLLESVDWTSGDYLTETEVNDFIWFATDIWPEWIGETEESILNRG